jgi:hypothetical protein
MTRDTVVNMANEDSSITVAQQSIVSYLENSSSIGEVSSLEVSVSHSNPRAIGKEPLRWSEGKVTGGTVDMNPAIIVVTVVAVVVVIEVSGYPILAIAIVTKLCNQWIKPYSGVK